MSLDLGKKLLLRLFVRISLPQLNKWFKDKSLWTHYILPLFVQWLRCDCIPEGGRQQVHVVKKKNGERKDLFNLYPLSLFWNIFLFLYPSVNHISVILPVSFSLSIYSSSWMSCALSLIGLFFPFFPPMPSICMQIRAAADFITSSVRSPGGLLKFHLTPNKKNNNNLGNIYRPEQRVRGLNPGYCAALADWEYN